MKPLRLSAIALPALLVSCGDSQRVAGGVDGNPNFLEGSLVLPGGSDPASHVPVVLSGASPAARATEGWSPRDTTWTDSLGRYRFPLTIDGRYRLEARVGDSLVMSRELDYHAGSGLRLEAAVLPLPAGKYLVVADFETLATTSSPAPWFSDAFGLRLLSNDSTRLRIAPASIVSDPASGATDCPGHGRCYHVTTTLVASDAASDPTEIYDMFRPSPNDCFDLSAADSITLAVRGTGELLLSWWGKDLALTRSTWSMPTRIVPLASDWTTLTIPTDSIRFPWDADSVPWSGSCLHKITFGLRGQGELWIDDIRLHGVDLLDLQTP